MQSQRVKGAIWVYAAWITAFLIAAHLINLSVISWLKVGKVDGGFVVWALIFAGLGVGVFKESRGSARWLVFVQGFWFVRIAVDVLTGFMPPYYLMLFGGGLFASIAGAMHLRRVFKEAGGPNALH